MPFNANTYRMNQYRKKAWEELAQAREIRARVQSGTAYDWELPRIAHFAALARSSMRLYLNAKKIRDISNRN